jgi:hypothetical protein
LRRKAFSLASLLNLASAEDGNIPPKKYVYNRKDLKYAKKNAKICFFNCRGYRIVSLKKQIYDLANFAPLRAAGFSSFVLAQRSSLVPRVSGAFAALRDASFFSASHFGSVGSFALTHSSHPPFRAKTLG